MAARAELLAPLGLKPAEVLPGEHLIGTRIEADPTGATAVPGVWVAGNLADPQAQVVTAAAAGSDGRRRDQRRPRRGGRPARRPRARLA